MLEEVQTVMFKYREDSSSHQSKASLMKDGPKIGPGDKVGPKKLHVCFHYLLNSLRAIAKYSAHAPTGDNTDVFKDGIFPYPFQDLFYLKQNLANFKKETSEPRANHTQEYNAECDSHIDLLIEYSISKMNQTSNCSSKS